ncbi:hypothetical protein DRO61_04625 [Candidatus Bathyarchaeota archaeon]|nr:MAG: hypothetical protein DRO61_04625 [Candidatus Bathyarchaeota archaeon]
MIRNDEGSKQDSRSVSTGASLFTALLFTVFFLSNYILSQFNDLDEDLKKFIEKTESIIIDLKLFDNSLAPLKDHSEINTLGVEDNARKIHLLELKIQHLEDIRR